MQLLADHEETLALFAEGIAGRYFHIRASDEFGSHKRFTLSADGTGQSSDTVYLPEQLDAPDRSGYRVLLMEQLGLRECGTFRFRMARALQQVPALTTRYEPPNSRSPRTGDYHLLFGTFDQPGLAAELFNLFERARVLGYLSRTYPGMRRHIHSYASHILELGFPTEDPFICGTRCMWGESPIYPQWEPLTETIKALMIDNGTVYTSVSALCDHYDSIREIYAFVESTPYQPQEESLPDWLSREERIEEWQEDLEGIEMAMAVEMLQAEDVEAERGQTDDTAVREADIDIKSLQDERDTLKRRIDMEKSSVQHALGADRSNARSYRYDEWDHNNRAYLRHWCRVFEEDLTFTAADPEIIDTLRQTVRQYQSTVQKQLEQIRPTGLQRVTRIQDGDELDLNAIIEARQDIRAGQSPDERFYSRKERMHRDVGAVFLVDLSASTDDPIEPPEPTDWSNYDPDKSVNLRDPWDDPEDEEFDEEPKRKIIDIQREAMVVMASALDALGDTYGIYGFSGYGKDCVEIFVAKELDQAFTVGTLEAIAAMSPKRSTRMGPAIRHSVHRLMGSGHAMKVLIMISDGFPQDADYGPERGNHEYGLQDTAKALEEAQQKGVETFCLTVDRSGQDYLKRMCPDARYMVIEEMEDLPDQLSKIYATLTGR
ncbi:MAG: hypothetical protein AAF541_03915 [Pseudomonadota bacterium]